MEKIQIFDTTLRDGEQSPGFSMNRDEKLKLAHQIEELGVDVLEAGFPSLRPAIWKRLVPWRPKSSTAA